MKIPVKNTKFSRDLRNMALLCTDKSEVTKYKSEMLKHEQNAARDSELNNLKTEIADLKEMLQAALQKIDRG